MQILYELFKEYYKKDTGDKTEISYSTYHKYFRNHSEYFFRSPRTDVCDFCQKCEVKLKVNPNDDCKNAYKEHLHKVSEYKAIRQSYLSKVSVKKKE